MKYAIVRLNGDIGQAQAAANYADAFIRFHSQRTDHEVRGFAIESDFIPNFQTSFSLEHPEARAHLLEQGYDADKVCVWAAQDPTFDPNAGGRGGIGQKWSVAYNNGNYHFDWRYSVIRHEMLGHSMGLHHAALTNTETNKTLDIGDRTTFMGYGPGRRGITLAQELFLGWKEPMPLIDGVAYLSPTRCVQIGDITLSVRATKGHPYCLGSVHENKVFMHRRIRNGHWERLTPEPYLLGDVVTLPDGTEIEAVRGSDQVGLVSVLADTGQQLTPDDSGLWVNRLSRDYPHHDGQGFSISFVGDRLMVNWFTYDDQGNHRWHYASTTNPKEPMTLYSTHGNREQYKAGRCAACTDGTTVSFAYESDEIGEGILKLKRLLKSSHHLDGPYAGDMTNDGYTLHVFPDSAAVIHWGYAGGKQKWWTMAGEGQDGTYQMNRTVTSGARFGSLWPVTENVLGSHTLRIGDGVKLDNERLAGVV